jgi:hypothetical protein
MAKDDYTIWTNPKLWGTNVFDTKTRTWKWVSIAEQKKKKKKKGKK